MKIIEFQGGLGNQLFEEVFSRWLSKRFPNDRIYGFYPQRALKCHNGLEIEKWFDVELPKHCPKSNRIGMALFWTNKVMRRLRLPLVMTFDDINQRENTLFYEGYFQDRKYVEEVGAPAFRKDIALDEKNSDMLLHLKQPNAVAVHVRRGDYTDPSVNYIYGGICTPEYYQKAIAKAASLIPDAHFFFFSDDKEYVKANFKVDNMTIVDFNKGDKSFLDMYLMAHASNMILANSTFSWWAAMLNKNVSHVICPDRWKNTKPVLNLIKSNWIVVR